jgi:hypothetical protein
MDPGSRRDDIEVFIGAPQRRFHDRLKAIVGGGWAFGCLSGLSDKLAEAPFSVKPYFPKLIVMFAAAVANLAAT